MKKVLLLLMLLVLFLTSFCGGEETKKAPKKSEPIPKFKVMDQMKEQPDWVELGSPIGKHDGEKVVFFNGLGVSKYKDTAKEAAQLNAATSAAEAIKAVASKQVARAWENIGAGDNETKEQVMKSIEVISARKVNVSGLRRVAVYWRLVVKSKIKNGKLLGWKQPEFEYYVRYAMSYDTYKTRRDKVLKTVEKSSKLNKRQKKLFDDIEAKLTELDEE